MTEATLHKDLMSLDIRRREAAWETLLTTLVPRIERRLSWKLRNAPPYVRQSLDDIRNEVMSTLVEKLMKATPIIKIERFALGIADNMCRRALDVSRDRERGLGGEDGGPLDTPSPDSTVRRTVMASNVRKAVRPAITCFRNSLETMAVEPRTGGPIKAPVLLFHAMDLAMTGHDRPADLKTAAGLTSTETTRVRAASLDALADQLDSQLRPHAAPSSTVESELSWDDLQPGTLLPDIWFELSTGCVDLDPPFLQAHPTHEEDLRAYQRCHRARCPECGVPIEPADEETLAAWAEAAERSLTRSGIG